MKRQVGVVDPFVERVERGAHRLVQDKLSAMRHGDGIDDVELPVEQGAHHRLEGLDCHAGLGRSRDDPGIANVRGHRVLVGDGRRWRRRERRVSAAGAEQ